MTAVSLPLRFQVGARTLASIHRRLVRVPLSLEDALSARTPTLPPLDRDAHGYAITSLPEALLPSVAVGGRIAFVRQHYTRRYADLTLGFDSYWAALSGNTRSTLKRKTKKVTAASAGSLDIRRFRTPDEILAFHDQGRQVSALTYQEKLLGSGLPDDPAFMRTMIAAAAADEVRAWLLVIDGKPAAYLYCSADGDTLRYDYVGHDPDFSDLSPGGVLQVEAMRDLCAEGRFRRFDFTEGDGQHKRSFATGGVDCVDLLLLRATPTNRLATLALRSFDGATALAKRTVEKHGLQALAKRIRR